MIWRGSWPCWFEGHQKTSSILLPASPLCITQKMLLDMFLFQFSHKKNIWGHDLSQTDTCSCVWFYLVYTAGNPSNLWDSIVSSILSYFLPKCLATYPPIVVTTVALSVSTIDRLSVYHEWAVSAMLACRLTSSGPGEDFDACRWGSGRGAEDATEA